MEFSELVHFRNELFNYSSTVIKQSADHDIKQIINLVQSQTFVTTEFSNELQDKYNSIQETFDKFELSLVATKEYVQNLIKNIEPQWFEESSQRYNNYKIDQIKKIHDDGTPYQDEQGIVRQGKNPFKIAAKNIFVEQTLNTSSSLSDNKKQLVHLRMGGYSDWHHSAMIIRPGLESFIDNMVANDPLYIIDEYLELLSPFMDKFNQTYQNRLRPYLINEFCDNPILEKLPNNQFRICLVFNYFDRKPIEIISRYLEEIFQKLQPGGILGMTFNDCDRRSAVLLVEKLAAFYTPGNAILSVAKNIGYEEVFRWNDEGPTTWIELQKPGTKVSIRGGQPMAKIIRK